MNLQISKTTSAPFDDSCQTSMRPQKNNTCRQLRAMLLGVMLLVSCGATPCTGNSTKLPAAQCEAWIDLYDSTSGDKWTGNAVTCTRTDPCSCDTSVAPYTWQVCDPTNTMVQTM